MSLLRRLMLFLSLALVPLVAMEAYNQVAIRQARMAEVRQQALNVATLIDAAQDGIIQGVRQSLGILRTLPIIRGGSFAACQAALTQAKQGFPEYLEIQATDADGTIRCATDTPSIGLTIADRPHVQTALRTGRFTVGTYIRVRTTGEPALPFAVRYDGTDGRPGVVTAHLSLAWLTDFLEAHPLPDGAVADIADRDNILLARLPEVPGLVGSRLPDRYLAMIQAAEPGTAELTGLDGVQRLFGYVPLARGAEGLFVAVGFDEQAVMASINEAAIRFAVLVALLAVAGLLLVWRYMRRQVAEPVTALVAATARWRRGDHTARAALTRGSAEMITLGQAFDDLAGVLEAEERTRKEAEAALRLSEARLRSIVDTAVDAFVVIDSGGTIQAANPAAERLFGYRADEMAGQNVRMLMPEPDRSRHDGYIANYLGTGERRIIGIGREVLGLRKDNSTFPLELSIAEWRVASERRFTGIMRDISGRRQAEDDLRQAKAEAERANLAKSKFLAAASHDLRQPLQSTYLFMEILRHHVAGAGTGALDHVQKGLDALTELLNRLLDVSRLDAGAVQPMVRPTVLHDVLADIEAGYAAAAAAKGVQWTARSCPLPVQTDPVLLSQLLRNLVDNAVKYTPSGEIILDCQEIGNRVRITVRDTGIGIPEEHLGQVFDEFFQVGNPERDRSKGLGLGLAIVRRLSMLLDHPVEVQSRPGVGTEFGVTLPIALETVRANDNRGVAAREATPGSLGHFVVLVDDEVVVLTALEMLLQSWGLEVLAASSPEEAVDRLRRSGRRPDLIVSDYRLREGRIGTEAVRAIREVAGADVPALIITGETGGDALRDAAAQRLPVLHKPVPPNVLRRELERHLGVG